MKEDMKGLYAAILLSMAVIFATNWLCPGKTSVSENMAETAKPEIKNEITAESAPASPSSDIAAVIRAGVRVLIRTECRCRSGMLVEFFSRKTIRNQK